MRGPPTAAVLLRAARLSTIDAEITPPMRTLLSITSLAAHLLAMNVAAAGPLACVWLMGLNAGHSEWARRVARLSIAALLVGGLLGGLLLVSPSEGMRAALARFSRDTYWFAAAELVFSLGCLASLLRLTRGPRRRPVIAWLVALATATNLLYHFPPLMAAIGKLAVEPRWASEAIITHRVLLRLAARPEVLSLWLHFILASLAGAAIFAFCMAGGTRTHDGSHDPSQDDAAVHRLGAAALIATLLQLPVGAWVLLASRGQAQDAVMGQNWPATSSFALGVMLAIGLTQTLATITGGDTRPATRGRAAGLFIAVALLMTATLTLSRAPDATPSARDMQSKASL